MRRKRWHWLLAAVACAGFGTALSHAQNEPPPPPPETETPFEEDAPPPPDEPPVDDDEAMTAVNEEPLDDDVPQSRLQPGTFHLNFTDMYLGMEADFENNRVDALRNNRYSKAQTNRDLLVNEYFGLRFDGDVIDPGLLNFQGGIEVGLLQSSFYESIGNYDRTENGGGFLLEYDFSLQALQSKPVSFSAYARRTNDRIPRRFLPTLHEYDTEFGGSVFVNTEPFTMEIGYAYTDVDRKGNRRDIDDESLTSSRFFVDAKWAINEDQNLKFNYEHERDDYTYQGSAYNFNTERDEFRFEYDLAFGSQKQHRFDTYFRYNHETGNLARDEILFTPRLTLQHSDQFQTIYRYSLYSYDQGALHVDTNRWDFEAVWRPIDELRTSFDSYALFERIHEDVDTTEWGLGVDVDYNRTTPWGELLVNGDVYFDQSRTTGDGGYRTVRDEAHRLGTIAPVFLKNLGVNANSIIVHDQRRTRVYVPGIDYTITVISGRAQVRRVLNGRIDENDVVYIDYEYVIPVNSNIDTVRADFLIEHPFDFGLTPYYYFESRFQNVDAARGSAYFRDNTDRQRMGLRYQADAWSVNGEYEIFDDTIEPYDAFHFTGQVSILRSVEHSLDFTGEFSRYYFESKEYRRNVNWLDLSLADRLQLTNDLSMVTQAAYRWEDDSVDGETDAVDVSWGVQLVRGYFSLDVTVDYDLLSIIENDNDTLGVYVNLRRDLSHMLRRPEDR